MRFAVFYSDRAEQGGRMASVNEETGSGYYSKGNEAFVAENYSSAIDLYTAALGIDHLFADCLVARAHAYIKSDKFEQAKEWMNDKNQAK